MSKLSCSCTCNRGFTCSLLSVAVSIIIGIITTLLTITAVIAVTPAFLWVLFGIAVVYLAITLIITSANRCSTLCHCSNTPLSLLLTGILGTILTSVILLAIDFAATSIIGALITGALLLFFSLIITSSVCIIKCLAGDDDDSDDIF